MNATDKSTVLVVDDDVTICEVIHKILARHGFELVVERHSARAALDFLQPSTSDSAPRPLGLAIIDVLLPDLSGFDLCVRLKDMYRNQLPVIMVSGYQIEDYRERYQSVGADDFLNKPFSTRELVQKVKAFLGNRTHENVSALDSTSLAHTLPVKLVDADDDAAGIPVWIGSKIGRFRIDRVICWGPASMVFRVKTVENEHFALKMLTREVSRHDEMVQRFEREESLLSRLRHPNIIQMTESGVFKDMPYYVMELIKAENLEEQLRKRHFLEPAEVADIGIGMGRALTYLHGMNIIHRDITLRNVLFEPEHNLVKIADFGISTAVDDVQITQCGCGIGTPLYMAPEAFESGSRSAAADIYSYGACLYHLLTGQPPLYAETTMQLVRAHLNGRPRPLRELRPELGRLWDQIITDKCLARRPEDRPHSVAQVVETLEQMRLT